MGVGENSPSLEDTAVLVEEEERPLSLGEQEAECEGDKHRHVEGSKQGSPGKRERGRDWEHRWNVGAPWEEYKRKHGDAQRTPPSLRLAGVPEPAARTALDLAQHRPGLLSWSSCIQAGALVALV